MLKRITASSAVASSIGLAGCLDGGAGQSDTFDSAISGLDFGNYEQRRAASFDEWSYDQRTQVPTGDAATTIDGWLDSESLQSAPWSPPEGWKDTAAADVDTIEVLNYGDIRFDPATAAVYALFERETGIRVEPQEVPMDQAIPRASAFLSSEQESPHLLQATTSSSMSTYAGNGWLQAADYLMPDDATWDNYVPLTRGTYNWNGNLWGGPGTLEGVPINVRPDLLEAQGLADELAKIKEGTWTWDDVESILEAFVGTDVYGYGFRGGSQVDAERDWRMLMYQTGAQYVQDDGTVSVNADGGGLIALEKLIEWKDEEWLPPDSVSWGEGELTEGFLTGQLAMAPVATDIVLDALDEYEADSEYIIARPPKGTAGPNPQHATYGGGPVSAVNTFAPTGHKIAGALFQDARFSEAASWWEYVVEGNMAPAQATYEQADQHDAVWMSSVRGQVMQDAKNEVFAQQRALTRKVSDEIRAAYAGEKEPKAALEEAQSYIDTVLSQS